MSEPRKTRTTTRSQSEAAGKKPARKARARGPKLAPEVVAERAYLISLGESAGSPEENWLRAERELLES